MVILHIKDKGARWWEREQAELGLPCSLPHTHRHTHTHKRSDVYVNECRCACLCHIRMHTFTLTHKHVHTHIFTHSNRNISSNLREHRQISTETQIHTQSQIHTNAQHFSRWTLPITATWEMSPAALWGCVGEREDLVYPLVTYWGCLLHLHTVKLTGARGSSQTQTSAEAITLGSLSKASLCFLCCPAAR